VGGTTNHQGDCWVIGEGRSQRGDLKTGKRKGSEGSGCENSAAELKTTRHEGPSILDAGGKRKGGSREGRKGSRDMGNAKGVCFQLESPIRKLVAVRERKFAPSIP